MLQIEGMKLSLEEDESLLAERAAALLRVPAGEIREVRILRRALDAREGVHLVYTLHVGVKHEAQVLRRCRNKKVSRAEERSYRLPEPVPTPAVPPVVVGAGPGGLFCALALARCGARPILLERGWNVERRQADVERFWSTGTLDTESNVQFGEGGAGAFSDGKLNTGTRDPRHRFILETLVSHGAPESILVDAKPHVGTDYLHRTLISLRRELEALGCDIRFGHRLTGLEVQEGHVTALEVTGPDGLYRLPARQVVLALGNSARDTFQILHAAGVPMEPKPLAVGVRIEHRQRDIDLTQYKELAGHPRLGAASYKLSCHLDSGRGVFSFCVCPGGQVVAAASEAERAVTNGMSLYAREGENCNGGLLVSVTPEDFPGGDRLPAGAGGAGLCRRGWRLHRPRPAGGGLPGPTAISGAGQGQAHLPPRRPLVRPVAGAAGRYLPVPGGGPASAGQEAPRLRRPRRGADGGGDPLLLPPPHPPGRGGPVRHSGPLPLRGGGGLRRGHPLRRRRRDADGGARAERHPGN